MIFEAAADHADAVGEQRRGDAVALEAEIGLAVEGEGEWPAAIDRPAFGKTECAHGAALRGSLAEHGVGRRVAGHDERFEAGQVQPDFPGSPFGLALK